MTNRRRSGKGRTSVAKKSESPDKHTRKLSRRGRRSKKSESPERPEEVESECSDEQEDGDKRLDREGDNDNYQDGNGQYESVKSSDDQRSQLKEEESGGSDGSWKVKSENGGGGGIPKLKLCLTRPPEMSSPTSIPEQHPSPRRRRRGAKGNVTPTKEEEPVEESVVEEFSKRVTRNQKSRELQESVVEDKPEPEVESQPEPEPEPEPEQEPEPEAEPEPEPEPELKETEEKEICNSNAAYNAEEDETRMAVESICGVQENEMNMVTRIQEEAAEKYEIHVMHGVHRVEKSPEEEETVEMSEPRDLEREEQESKQVEAEREPQQEAEAQREPEPEPEPEQEPEPEAEPEREAEPEAQPEREPEPEVETVVEDKRRSSSRDSSEERAKEAALRSRNKNKKKEGSEEGEVVESPGGELNRHVGSQEKSKTSSPAASAVSENDRKENLEESMPVKSGARKRRWGSSTTRTSKKPSVSISTDFLKEIIPEVKPLLLSEVQLSPNEEDEEGQLKDSEENLPVVASKGEKEKIVQSDESEKDYEEEPMESGMDESTQLETAKPIIQVKEKEFTTFTRKVSVLSSNEKLQKSPSPPRHKPSNILYIVNLVRPFTIPQLRELLARTGTITEDGFWIDKIKSKCYVKYETEEEAKTTRHALHGVRWPVSNPKQLNVDFGTEAAMKAAMEGNDVAPKRPIPSLFDKQIDLKTGEKTREREREKSGAERGGDKRDRSEREKKDRKHREEDKREEEDEKDKKSRPPVEPLVRDRTVRRVTMPIREWDVGKKEDGFSPPPDGMEFSRHRDDRYERRVEYDRDKRDDYDDRRRRDKDRGRRSVSGEPPRKSKKKNEEEAPAKLLDDLFRKTKATPCIYWLPLTPEQISVKEEMRRKHMAEHEKKVAELRKMQREQSKRSSDKRRRRTKSRSRSRSTKK